MIRYNNISRPVHDPPCDPPATPTTPLAKNLGVATPNPPGLTPLSRVKKQSRHLKYVLAKNDVAACKNDVIPSFPTFRTKTRFKFRCATDIDKTCKGHEDDVQRTQKERE